MSPQHLVPRSARAQAAPLESPISELCFQQGSSEGAVAPSRGQSICQTGGAGTHLLEEVREDRHTVRLGHQHGCWSVEDREYPRSHKRRGHVPEVGMVQLERRGYAADRVGG